MLIDQFSNWFPVARVGWAFLGLTLFLFCQGIGFDLGENFRLIKIVVLEFLFGFTAALVVVDSPVFCFDVLQG
jgi:hypothetical protein